ncbi:type 1 glutamine amidotransferase domain-containing protein [Aestuariibacter salexigens]|uniref:type 1 glutamine amidotransferase domain-containing protein n=1 Tax=Aestuariibacter salexigens TaxID=226010 RepID=UPI0003F72580|nr:type 1 glutamine amidotransferase domain-containing protein [Aestuariibacter salexigens]
MIKKLIISLVVIAALFVSMFYGARAWLKSALPERAYIEALKQTTPSDLSYINENVPASRGRILTVLTNVNSMGEGEKIGYEHTELARAYWVFTANGFDVDFASPQGGKPPVVIDGDDMGAFDYAFLNATDIQDRIDESIPVSKINPLDYAAVYFVGGKGAMFDFPDNPDIQRIIKALYQHDRVISAVCHGPAALVNVTLDDGTMLLADKAVTGFTNEEELFLIPDAITIFPFLLEDKLIQQGALFDKGDRYLEQVTQHGKVITGQNPWSVWKMAEMVVAELGYTPKQRTRTPEELAIDLLMTYERGGYNEAYSAMIAQPQAYQRITILMHGIVSFMEFDIGKGIDLLRLTHHLKELAGE